MEIPFAGEPAEAHRPLCPWLALAWAAHVPCWGEGHSIPNSAAERAAVLCGLGEEAISEVCRQEVWGGVNDLPVS